MQHHRSVGYGYIYIYIYTDIGTIYLQPGFDRGLGLDNPGFKAVAFCCGLLVASREQGNIIPI